MKLNLILNLTDDKNATLVDTDNIEILSIEPYDFENISKDHKPGEYLYSIMSKLYYKSITVNYTPIEVYPETRVKYTDNSIEFYQENVNKTKYNDIGMPICKEIVLVESKTL